MEFLCQEKAVQTLIAYAKSDIHSMLISGPVGCGKTYLARYYGTLLQISDIIVLPTSVGDLRNTIDSLYEMKNPILCILENLDVCLPVVSSVLLKFIEEPPENLYVVITARNVYRVLDTIRNRCMYVECSLPYENDVLQYIKYKQASTSIPDRLLQAIRTFSDIDSALQLSQDQITYMISTVSNLKFTDSVSGNTWKITHFPDKSVTPIHLVLSYWLHVSDIDICKLILNAIDDITLNGVSEYIVLNHLFTELKYKYVWSVV